MFWAQLFSTKMHTVLGVPVRSVDSGGGSPAPLPSAAAPLTKSHRAASSPHSLCRGPLLWAWSLPGRMTAAPFHHLASNNKWIFTNHEHCAPLWPGGLQSRRGQCRRPEVALRPDVQGAAPGSPSASTLLSLGVPNLPGAGWRLSCQTRAGRSLNWGSSGCEI